MSVCLNNHLSKSRVVLAGVPQGSILGPLLFLLYINDLFNIPIPSKIDLYADDSTIHFSGQSVEYVNDVLNEDLTLIVSWSKYNSLELNYTKSKCMLISTPQYLKHQSQKNLMVHIGSNFLENVSKHKVLGVIVDNKLSWSSHIDYITKNAICASKPSTESKISSQSLPVLLTSTPSYYLKWITVQRYGVEQLRM